MDDKILQWKDANTEERIEMLANVAKMSAENFVEIGDDIKELVGRMEEIYVRLEHLEDQYGH